jgi:preprotein translocase subunit YajC
MASFLPLTAQAARPQANIFSMLVPFLLMIVIFYFLVIMPQRRQHKLREKMLAAVKKGDEVVTTGGMFGRVVGVNADTVTLKVDEGTTVKMQKSAVTSVVSVTK